jgi:hypothetical protein
MPSVRQDEAKSTKVGKLQVESHRTFANLLNGSQIKGGEGDASSLSVAGLVNKALPIIYGEEDPVKHCIDLVAVGRAQIHKPGSQLHKQQCMVKSAGADFLLGFCEIEPLSFNGKPNGNAVYLSSTFLRPFVDSSVEEMLKSENHDLQKKNKRLEVEIKLLRNADSTAPSAADTPVAVATRREDHEPTRAVARPMPRPGPDLRMSVADGSGLWQNNSVAANKKPFNCPICSRGFKSTHGLSVHKYAAHGGVDNGPRLKECQICHLGFPVNNFKKHDCNLCT